MSSLVVYYSLDGNTRCIAAAIAAAVGADLLELTPQDQRAPRGFMKYIWGGRQVVSKHRPRLCAFAANPEDYDMLFIGTPVWAGSYAPALATFFFGRQITGKKVAFFCCHGRFKGKTFEHMKARLPLNDCVGEIDFFEPLRHDRPRNIQRAEDWAKRCAG